MQFIQGFPSDTPRPSVFDQQMPQSLGSNTADGTAPWLHTPPAQMPWGINQPTLVRFTGDSPNFARGFNSFSRNPLHSQIKRKIEPETEIMPATKLHITEEKMAAHMSRLRITNDAAMNGGGSFQCEPMCSDTADGISNIDTDAQKDEMKRLFICEEIQKYKDEILPSAILCKLEKPTTALMLWQPPSGILCQTLRDRLGIERVRKAMEEEEEERRGDAAHMVDNNNSSSLDLNMLTLPGYSQSTSSSVDDMDL